MISRRKRPLIASIKDLSDQKLSVTSNVTSQPSLMLDVCSDLTSCRVIVRDLDPEIVFFLKSPAQSPPSLQSFFRVSVLREGMAGSGDLPSIFGHFQILENEIRFVPYFAFETGIRYLASFDLRTLDRFKSSRLLTLEFSFPSRKRASCSEVEEVFPSADVLPENLLRFYLRFSNPMQGGQVEKHIQILGPDGQPAPDVLYRSPVELWNRSMRCLTILLDPGRLKRGVGPNRELGPPLRAGLDYTLKVDSGMIDCSTNTLRESFFKTFRVTEPVRDQVAIQKWKIFPPRGRPRQPLALVFPRPLDWAMLFHSIRVVSEKGHSIEGRINLTECEQRWTFTPTFPWAEGRYHIDIASDLEDVSGNNLLSPFERPLQASKEMADQKAIHSLSFTLG